MQFICKQGKVKSLMENRGAFQIDPTPNFDSHVSKSANVDVSQASPQQSFESTQIYLYQYEDCEIVERPKQICPYAVVYFKYVGETKSNKPPPKQVPKSRLVFSLIYMFHCYWVPKFCDILVFVSKKKPSCAVVLQKFIIPPAT